MGAWGTGVFDNDDACDFAAEVANGRDLIVIERALERTLATSGDYLEAPDGSLALAAADIVARLNGKFGERNAYTSDIDAWVQRTKLTPSDDLTAKAHQAVQRVITAPSELIELWEDSNDFAEWKVVVAALSQRLQ